MTRHHRHLVVSFLTSTVVVFVLWSMPAVTRAADLHFTDTVTVNLTGVSFATFTIAAGSEADVLTVDTNTLTVSVASGDTFTLHASANITLSNTANVATTCGSSTSRLVLTGPVTNIVVTPANTTCVTASAADRTPPAAPQFISATADAARIVLAWTDPVDADFSRILILRNSGDATPVSGVPFAYAAKGARTYTDIIVTPGTTYTYMVRAEDTSGNASMNVDVVSAMVVVPPRVPTPPPSAPPAAPPSSAQPPAPVTQTPPSSSPAPSSRPSTGTIGEPPTSSRPPEPRVEELDDLRRIARDLMTLSTDAFARSSGMARDVRREQAVARIVAAVSVPGVSSAIQERMTALLAYPPPRVQKLGAGEIGGTLQSARIAFGTNPTTVDEWEDVLKIATGRFPSARNLQREQDVVVSFRSVYKRAPNRENKRDDAAIMIMAYGLRQADGNRNLAKERVAIITFRAIFRYNPFSAQDWDVVRAIAYSGATR